MSKLTNSLKGSQERHVISDTIAAGSGTFLLLIAENLPESFLFKNWVIMAVPSLSVFLAKIADLIFGTFRAIVNTFGIMQTEKKVVRQLKELRKNSYVVKEDVEQLEAAYAAIRVRTAEQTLNKLDRLSRD